MIDSVQIILLVVIIILTVLLVTLGTQVFFILKDIRRTLAKANTVLDHANAISKNISTPISALSSLTSTLQAGSAVTLVKLIRALITKERSSKE